MSIVQENNPKSGFRKFCKSLDSWFEYKDKGKWIEEMKASIIIAASMVATMTFTLGTNPPGGVVQVGLSDVSGLESVLDFCSNVTGICAGSAVLGILYHNGYIAFLACNTICFIASLSLIFLLVSGIPMENTFTMWLLSSCMCITITSLALTYLFAAILVTPDTIWPNYDNVFAIALIVWAAIVIVFHGVRIVRFFVRKCNCICN
ncbi:hypothetical protein TSUD_357560 [Trifolium subterraneum]|uniref:PGG domain-containing protein n=1 Tax=Trifolium subterraneum TaxID=3900 RepID=A0A2Z6MAA6_TRISU|nr:hypothetical protein TSUD_357560 [Trifolium subterraneum]